MCWQTVKSLNLKVVKKKKILAQKHAIPSQWEKYLFDYVLKLFRSLTKNEQNLNLMMVLFYCGEKNIKEKSKTNSMYACHLQK